VLDTMKKDIHPKYYPNAKVTCACGNTFETGSTKPEIRTDLCSACHPFFTGEMRIVDTAGQVDRFVKRLEKRTEMIQQEVKAKAPKPVAKRSKKIVYELVDEETPAAPAES
jgi:large subunit ribosomal protein L31